MMMNRTVLGSSPRGPTTLFVGVSMKKNNEYNLFNEILYMIDNWCDDSISFINRNDFIVQVHNQWSRYQAYPRMVSISKKSITVVWSNEFRDKYLRNKN